MPPPEISVIVPTYNRCEALREMLLALAQQTLPPNYFEVILVDDGSTEALLDMLAAVKLPYAIHFFQQSHLGPAAARNLGSQHAAANMILFLDADTVPAPDLLEQHQATRQDHPDALVAGRRLPYPPALQPWEMLIGHYDKMTQIDPEKPDFGFQEAVTCNLSILKSGWGALGGFDESFPPGSGFEDIEFSYRWTKRGYPVVFNLNAICYHNHPLSFGEFCAQNHGYHLGAPLLFQKHPELKGQIAHLRDKETINWRTDQTILILRKWARLVIAWRPILSCLENVASWLEKICVLPNVRRSLYWKIIASHQLKGLREGYRKYGR